MGAPRSGATANAGDGSRVEILLTLPDAQGVLVAPTEFLPAAQRYGLVGHIDRWLIITVVGRIVAREAAGMPALALALCSIKLLGSSFRQLSFQKFIGDQLSLLRVPGQLCLEVSESAALNHLDDSAAFIVRLRGYGCRIALDEFGNGPLSFASLRHLPVDYVKIAGAFVRDCISDPIGLAVTESIQRIVRAMDIQSTACAVDNPLVLAKVRQPGVDFCAGSHFGRPRQWRPLEQIAAVN